MKPEFTVVFTMILNMGITAGYCIAAILLLRFVFRKAPRKYLYLLWLLAGFRLVCPVSVETEFSLFGSRNFAMSAPTEEIPRMQYLAEDAYQAENAKLYSGIGAVDTWVNIQLPRAVSVMAGHSPRVKGLLWADGDYQLPIRYLLYYGKYVWAAGMGIFLLYMLLGCLWMKRKVRLAVRAEGCGFVQGKIPVYECDEISSPFVMGVFRPLIYLPCGLGGEERDMVLLHEQFHIRRKDHLVKLLAFILLAVYWFHPLVWAAWFCMRKDMEMSCDEYVLEQFDMECRKAYSRTLLAFARPRPAAACLPLGFGENDVKSRITHILSFRKPPAWAAVPAILLLACLAVFLGTNGKSQEREALPGDTRTIAEKLYESRNPYIGDVPAEGELLGVIAEALPDSLLTRGGWKMALQTAEEPYEFCFQPDGSPEGGAHTQGGIETEEDLYRMTEVSALMLALTDNLGVVKVQYQDMTANSIREDCPGMASGGRTEDGLAEAVWTIGSIEEAYQLESLKAYGESPEKVDELLHILLAD